MGGRTQGASGAGGLPGRSVRLAQQRWTLAWVGLVGVTMLGLSMGGLPEGVGPEAGLAAMLLAALSAGMVVGVYALAALGLGTGLLRAIGWGRGAGQGGGSAHDAGTSSSGSVLLSGSASHGGGAGEAVVPALAVGVALLMWLSHALGQLGLLTTATAGGVLGIGGTLGVAWLMEQSRGRARAPGLSWSAMGSAPAVGVMLLAACATPGFLWRSEAGGYDALSYHLALPMEWSRAGRLTALEHNVYSYLPMGGMAQALWLHVTELLGGAGRPGEAGGLLALDGLGLIVCQWLSAALVLLGGAGVGRAVRAEGLAAGLSARGAAIAGGLAGAAVVSVPWVVVIGSLAYNEGALLAFGACGVLAGLRRQEPAWRRGLVVGLLLGAAGGSKPTAAFLVMPWVVASLGVGLRGAGASAAGDGQACGARGRWWGRAVCAGACAAVGGLVMLGPVLARSWVASGNPVFPFASAVFGSGHWGPEQLARFGHAHGDGQSAWERLGALVSMERLGAAQDALGNTPRGVFHAQWSMFFSVAVACAALGLGWRRTGPLAGALAAGALAGVAWWVAGSHGQSRFLIPLAVPLSVCIGLAACGALAVWRRGIGWACVGLACAVPAVLSMDSARALMRQGLGPTGPGLGAGAGGGGGGGGGGAGGSGIGAYSTGLVQGVGGMTGEFLGARLRLEAQRAGRQGDPRELAAGLRAAGVRSGAAIANILVPPDERLLLVGEATTLYYLGRVSATTAWDSGVLEEAMGRWPSEPARWVEALRGAQIGWVLINLAEVARLARSGYLDPRLSGDRLEQLVGQLPPAAVAIPESGYLLVRVPGQSRLGEP